MERERANMSQTLLSRRAFAAWGASCASGALLDARTSVGQLLKALNAAPEQTVIQATKRSIEVNGKTATMMGLQQSDGKHGLSLVVNQPFDVLLENKLLVPTAIYWHGLHPPNSQDGVPGLTQPVIAPGASAKYNFRTLPSGTHWMHSHEGLQEAFLLAAPLIVHDPADEPTDEQQIILFLGDFSFTPPREILERLQHPAAKPMKKMSMNKPDANDVDYDAYLANDRTLADPDVVRITKNARIRLRIINGSSGTNFFISLGDLEGDVISTDGMAVKPFHGSRFPLAIAQRIDVRMQLPRDGAFPILASRENGRAQTGFILATPGAAIKKLPLQSSSPAGLLDLGMEGQLEAVRPLAPKPIDRTFELRLAGNMAKYDWPHQRNRLRRRKPAHPKARGDRKIRPARRNQVHQRNPYVSPHAPARTLVSSNRHQRQPTSRRAPRHRLGSSEEHRNRRLRRRHSRHLVSPLPHPLASRGRHGCLGSLRIE